MEKNDTIIKILKNLLVDKAPSDQAWFKWCLDLNLLCYNRGEFVPDRHRCQKLLIKMLKLKPPRRKKNKEEQE